MTPTENRNEHLIQSYNRMVDRVKAAFDHGAERGITPSLIHAIDLCKDKAVTLRELSREEAERIGNFLRRDLEDAAQYLAKPGGELADWMRFDLELIEERLVEAFLVVADRTQVELSQWAEEARHADEYLAEEITGPGTLQCVTCGDTVRFYETSHIPVCPKCGSGVFKRSLPEQDA